MAGEYRQDGSFRDSSLHVVTSDIVNFGPLTAEIGLPVWGTAAHFNGSGILGELLHSTLVVGISQTLRH